MSYRSCLSYKAFRSSAVATVLTVFDSAVDHGRQRVGDFAWEEGVKVNDWSRSELIWTSSELV